MLFVSISEFGLNDDTYENLLEDLRKRAKRLKGSSGFQHRLVMTFGTTDLIEIACFNHYFHFAELGSSSSQSFRRSVGAHSCDLPRRRQESIAPIKNVLGRDGTFPFLAVMYLKLSPVPVLFMPTNVEVPLSHRLLRRFCDGTFPLWSTYTQILERSIGEERAGECMGKLRVSPLIGLDAVEFILVVRAMRLEQIAALGWAVRTEKLGNFWKVSEGSEVARRMWELLQSNDNEAQTQEDLVLSPENWNNSPLFTGTTTVIGMPMHRKKQPSTHWEFEPADRDDREAARAAFFTVRNSFTPGSFRNAIRPYQLMDKQESQIESNGALSDSDEAGQDSVFLMLFDRADHLSLPQILDIEEKNSHFVSPQLVKDLQKHKGDLAGINGRSKVREGVKTHTELAVRVAIPEEIALASPNDIVFKLFRERLRKQRRVHLQRRAPHTIAWTSRWLMRAKRLGFVYSATNKIVKIIHTTLDNLEIDLEGFVDLLPALERFVRAAESRKTRPVDLHRYLRVIEAVTATRCRQDHPLRAPHTSLALEGNSGYRLSRDAFTCFAETVCADIDPKASLVVQDSSAGGVTCAFERGYWNVVRVSTLSLHHPVHWLVSHGLAHGFLAHTSLEELENESPGAIPGQTLRLIFNRMKLDVDSRETLDQLAERTRAFVKGEGSRHPLLLIFYESLCRSMRSLIADICLWRSLEHPDRNVSDTHNIFWFIHGPGLLFYKQYEFGFQDPDFLLVQSLIVRCVLTSYVLDRVNEPFRLNPKGRLPGWFLELRAVVLDIKEQTLQDRPLPSSSPLPLRLLCVKEDLRIREDIWMTSVSQLWEALNCASRESGEILHSVELWLKYSIEIGMKFRFLGDASSPRCIYGDYLAKLVEMWGKAAEPWLPRTVSHKKEESSTVEFRFRKRRFGPHFARRGGVIVQLKEGDQEGQRAYRQMTYDFFATLGELARRSRFDKLKCYLRGSLL